MAKARLKIEPGDGGSNESVAAVGPTALDAAADGFQLGFASWLVCVL
ncbi:MAG TPA: hypothetical protein PK867_14190 [Pirellulales bacterium]|nr:hypothetical protein [Pirellulales bacterium]